MVWLASTLGYSLTSLGRSVTCAQPSWELKADAAVRDQRVFSLSSFLNQLTTKPYQADLLFVGGKDHRQAIS